MLLLHKSARINHASTLLLKNSGAKKTERRIRTPVLLLITPKLTTQQDLFLLHLWYIPSWEIEANTDAFETKLRARLRERWHMRYALPWGLIQYGDAKDMEWNHGVIE
jgi:hypothetical protein